MHELTLHLDPAAGQALEDLADACGRPPEDIAREAVDRYLHEESTLVRAVGERIAREHADLLRRLGE
ncbi:hypothetical protein [Streptomyces fulvoviolaceus]|uniref:hypothetical protein n=1 Tax=Streptomyces fulvoviolaceus TaxID=285535 RepID=UPI0004CB7132|nr:hypothetical protein [Streptomyces fulvoviolaceus]MCT9077252.1 ribbon-helix-helix domain-containing protein [Streptomyces fulvoviolaceus]